VPRKQKRKITVCGNRYGKTHGVVSPHLQQQTSTSPSGDALHGISGAAQQKRRINDNIFAAMARLVACWRARGAAAFGGRLSLPYSAATLVLARQNWASADSLHKIRTNRAEQRIERRRQRPPEKQAKREEGKERGRKIKYIALKAWRWR